MQDVGSMGNTSGMQRDATPQMMSVVCRIPWTLSACWKLDRIRGQNLRNIWNPDVHTQSVLMGRPCTSRSRDAATVRTRRLNWRKNRTQNLLLLPLAASFLCNIRHTSQMWRKRVGVEPTIRPAKDRIAGFEGRGSHRTPFASERSIAGEEKCFPYGLLDELQRRADPLIAALPSSPPCAS
jgi:hypothetical protein